MKTTPWYPGTVKPVRVGFYEREYPSGEVIWQCFWNGRIWINPWNPPQHSEFQNLQWRGLTEKAR